ncbi:site-specific integrase [Hymenobacter rubripertinctus]|uniref:Site-specific integrase n=1 Tax=Hymenobacter rubripertinctus TaxID=2029981 RepID=A0A418R378_9BACT|nr:site-specific integrase [Hymenobacter rubripertinctus]RIY11801.1 site-specific integrase [Hymenobacter rubripertinctus]
MTVQFERRTDRPDAAGRCTIHLRAYFDGQRLRLVTREKCLASEWQTDKQKFRRSKPGFQEANEYLDSLAARVQAAYRQLRTSGIEPTPADLKAFLAPPPPVEKPKEAAVPPLIALFDEYRLALAARGRRASTLKGVKTTRNLMEQFEGKLKRKLTLAAYDVAMHDQLLTFLRNEKKLAQNSIWKVVKHIKAMLAYLGEDRGLTLALKVRQLKAAWVDVDKVYLLASDLKLLEVAPMPAGLGRTRDAFLFCCYTGLRYSDLAELREGNLHEWSGARVLRLTQTKTRTSVSIYLTAAASALLDKYEGTGVRLMPVMTNQVMNRNLKKISALAGLREMVEVVTTELGEVVKRQVPKYELVTMHTARHTFATQSLLRGMAMEVLQKVMGHTRIQTTMIYAKIVEDFQHQEMRRIWDGETVAAVAAVPEVCQVLVAA